MQGYTHNRYTNHFQSIDSGELKFFPETYAEKPDLPSPAVDANGREVILVKIKDNLYTWLILQVFANSFKQWLAL